MPDLMEFSVAQIAALINGRVAGDANRKISTFAPINEAQNNALTFLSNPKYTSFIYTTQAAAVLVSNNFVPEQALQTTLIHVEDVYATLAFLLEKFQQQTGKKGIEQPSFIAEEVEIAEDVYIGAFTYIGKGAKLGKGTKVYPNSYIGEGVTVGQNTCIFAGVKVYANSYIGNNCILHSGCVIGSDGFGFAPLPDGSYKKIPQNGKVILHDYVEVGANTTIDRATINATVIGKGVKLDNLIQVAHNVEIGENTVIAAQAGISGSTKIGKSSMIGGQVGIIGHIEIAEGTQIGAQSGIAQTIKEPGKKWFGSPAISHLDAFRAQTLFKQLPDLFKRINELEAEVKALKQSKNSNE